MRYQIVGDDMQAVILDLDRSELVRAEAGSMMFMSQTIDMSTQMGTGKEGGLMGSLMTGLKRVVSGESLFVTTFRSENGPGRVAFSGPYPGKIIPLNLNETGDMICQRDCFLCSEGNVDINIALTKRLGAGLFGGEGFILQRLSGQGMVFIHAGGMIVPIDLEPGETLKADTGCLVAMTHSITYDIQMVKGIKSMLFGGEGLFLASFTGPGRVYLQSLPFSRMADRILMAGQGGKEESKGVAGIGGDLLGSFLSGND